MQNRPDSSFFLKGRKMKITNLQTRLYLITAVILLVGLGSAVLIYMTSENYSGGVLGYEIVGGSVHPIAPEESKKYIHDLTLYGGKAAVVADEFNRWFFGLWHGKSLSLTVACITIFISLGFFLVAYHLPSDLKSEVPDENNRAGIK
jgi:hypothetical protein